MKKEYQNGEGGYEKSYGGSSYNKDERSHSTGRKEEPAPPKARKVEPKPSEDAGSVSEEPQSQQEQKIKRMKTMLMKLFWLWLFLTILTNFFTWILNDDSLDEDVQSEETMDDPWGWDDEDIDEEALSVADSVAAMDVQEPAVSGSAKPDLKENAETAPKEKDANISDDDLSTLEALERRNHEDVVREAKRAGVSTEGTTLEIMERIGRKEMEKKEVNVLLFEKGNAKEDCIYMPKILYCTLFFSLSNMNITPEITPWVL